MEDQEFSTEFNNDYMHDDVNENVKSSSEEQKNYSQDLYKKWFRSKTQNGFLSIKPWMEALKLKIDIGKTSPDGKLISSTNVFVDTVDFAAYLKAIVSGTAKEIYTPNDRMGLPSLESFASYGGAKLDGKPVSRIFKAHYWTNGEEFDQTCFVWKCGHFNARVSDTGAFIPDMKNPLSVDFIKVTRQDISSISYIVDLAMNSYVSQNKIWMNNIK
jgi:hypothetical protein